MTTFTEPAPIQTPRRLAIVVTQEHIAKGERGDSTECAIALALHDLGYPHANVSTSGVELDYRDTDGPLIELPEDMHEWVAAFDADEPVHPERFVVDLPADWPEPAAVSRAS